MKHLKLRSLTPDDCIRISQAFKNQGWNKPESQYHRYLEDQRNNIRVVIVAELDGAFAGYLTILWKSNYMPFRELNIPEIVDFNVLKKFQKRGIGNALMEEAERKIKPVSDKVGIGVGILSDYGAAQRLYVKRGYLPDGRGVVVDSIPLEYNEEIVLSDDQIICLTKILQ